MKARLGFLAVGIFLSAWLPIIAPAPTAQAAGCDPGLYCGSLAVDLSGWPNGSFQTTSSTGVPDGVMNCTLTWGVLSPSTCSHRFEWDRPVAPVIYWQIIRDDPNVSYINTGPPYSFSTLISGQTVQVNRTLLWNNPRELDVHKIGTGAGSITSSPGPINCGSQCYWVYDSTYTITLTAAPSSGSHFVEWLGNPSCNHSTNPVCVHSLSDSTTNDMTAVFALNVTPPPVTPPPASARPSNTPTPTVKASVKPTSTPGVQPTGGAQPTAASGPTSPASTPGASTPGSSNEVASFVPGSFPAATEVVPSSDASTGPPASSAGPAGPTPNVGDPAVAGGSDSTGLIIVIIVAALIIGGGLVFLGLQLRAVARRPGPPPAA